MTDQYADIKKWSPRDMTPFGIHIYNGRRASGKSKALLHCISQVKHHYDYAVVFSGSPDAYETGLAITFPALIVEGYDPERMESIINKQKLDIMKQKRGDLVCPSKVLFVFDDVVGDPNWKKNCKTMAQVITNGRHMFIGVAIVTQKLSLVAPLLRQNCSSLFVTHTTNMDDVCAILAHTPNFRQSELQNLIDIICKNFGVMCIVCDSNDSGYKAIRSLRFIPGQYSSRITNPSLEKAIRALPNEIESLNLEISRVEARQKQLRSKQSVSSKTNSKKELPTIRIVD